VSTPTMRIMLVIASLSVSANLAEAQSSSPTAPRPALERLSAFEGTWRSTNPTDSAVFEEVCGWMAGGRRHMVCTPRWSRPDGLVQHQTTYSYRGRDSTYIVTAFIATGPVWTYHGRPNGDQWTFDLQGDRPNNPQRLRMIVTVARDTLRFVEESSENGGPWRVTEDYRHVRVSRTPSGRRQLR